MQSQRDSVPEKFNAESGMGHCHAAHCSERLQSLMGGGAGTRLFPLTKRSRQNPPCHSVANIGSWIIPISNWPELRAAARSTCSRNLTACRYTGTFRQFKLIIFRPSFIDILSCSTNARRVAMYQGTCRRGSAKHALLSRAAYDYYLILSGDQLIEWIFGAAASAH